MADVMLHSYSDALEKKGVSTDLVMICGGAIRGDSRYGPGVVTLGDILEILPFTDAIVVIQLDGEAIWASLEGALSKYPAQEGRFPIFAGMEVVADTSQPPGQRVKSVHLVSHHHRRRTKSANGRKASAPTTPDDSDSGDDDDDDAAGDESTVQFYPHPQDTGVNVEVRLGGRGEREELKREKGGRLYTVVTREVRPLGSCCVPFRQES
jgi:5'-nucleotidase